MTLYLKSIDTWTKMGFPLLKPIESKFDTIKIFLKSSKLNFLQCKLNFQIFYKIPAL